MQSAPIKVSVRTSMNRIFVHSGASTASAVSGFRPLKCNQRAVKPFYLALVPELARKCASSVALQAALTTINK